METEATEAAGVTGPSIGQMPGETLTAETAYTFTVPVDPKTLPGFPELGDRMRQICTPSKPVEHRGTGVTDNRFPAAVRVIGEVFPGWPDERVRFEAARWVHWATNS